ncbi:PREDICTED: uncharacterized protein LOC106745697 [Dinoponera quadriceps]|uniref:Gustatory receptor n=1 Tax=Dinoponera quadriceps TaxID=609295 RepID=A0A6P3XFK7_DINQU|nr:PREDICTED: uncharacterized protein LOC106745697 [Dinoponera quadriceps]
MDSKRKHLLPSTGQTLEKISRFCGINLSSYLGRLYNIVLVAFFCFLTHLTWSDVCMQKCSQHIIKRILVTSFYVLYTLLTLTLRITSLFRPKQFTFPYQEMLIVDSILESYGAQFSNKDIFIAKNLQDGVIISYWFLIVILFSQAAIVHKSIYIMWYTFRAIYLCVSMLLTFGLFSHYVNDIYLRFRELNKIAMRHSEEKLTVSYIEFTTAGVYDKHDGLVNSKIRSIQHIHHTLFVLAKKVNGNFNLPILLGSAILLNGIILYLYDIYNHIKLRDIGAEEVVFQIIFLFWTSLVSIYISYTCQRSRNESRRMTKILHDVFLKHKSLRSEVVYFSLQLVHEDLVFTGCGLFEYNMSLVCSIAGAILTYVVMFVQLDTIAKFLIVSNASSYVENNSTEYVTTSAA